MPEAAAWPIIGQDEAVSLLQRAIRRDGISHAYLIGGGAGLGKATLATAFAQAVACQAPDRDDLAVPCGLCLACRKIARNTHPDVQRYDLDWQRRMAEKKGGQNTTLTIETVRQAAANASLRPMEAARRFVIIDDAEAMQGVAQEALLKTLEEPPAAVVMLLLADAPDAMMATIQSRCQRITLRPVAAGTIVAGLTARGVAPEVAREAAAMAGGVPGRAVAAAKDPSLLQTARDLTARALDWVAGSEYSRLVQAVRLGDTYTKRRGEVRDEVEAALGIWRDVMLLQADQASLVVNQAASGQLQSLSAGWSITAATAAVVAAQQCLHDLDANVRPRLALENMVLRWPAVRSRG